MTATTQVSIEDHAATWEGLNPPYGTIVAPALSEQEQETVEFWRGQDEACADDLLAIIDRMASAIPGPIERVWVYVDHFDDAVAVTSVPPDLWVEDEPPAPRSGWSYANERGLYRTKEKS